MGGFFPVSPLIGIPNTSYAAQAGVMDGKWAARVVRGRKIIAEKTMTELDLDHLVGVIFGHARVEGLSRHAVAMCAGRLIQFARQYQQSGVCPNYEVGDLTRDSPVEEDGATGFSAVSPQPAANSEPSAASAAYSQGLDSMTPVGGIPQISQLAPQQLWLNSVENAALLLSAMVTYGAALSQDHLQAISENAAESLVHMWAARGDSESVLRKFSAMIQSCSLECHVERTGSGRTSLIIGNCEFIRVARELDPSSKIIPMGFPCRYHEMVARKVSSLVGTKISINTSSNGCTVVLSI
ncbi:MAG: hypothetical protein QXS20_07770 [Candidatus Thorarchaeota archaeon]